MRPSGVQRSDKLPEAFKAYNTCRSSIGLYLGSKCRFVFRDSIYKNQHPSSHFLCFSQKIHCQSESVTCQRFVRSTHLPPTFIRSLFSSVSDSIRSIYFSFNFYSPYGKNLSFLHPSPLFYLKTFVTTYRQCLVRQVTSHSSATGRVTRNCTCRVVEIQTN